MTAGFTEDEVVDVLVSAGRAAARVGHVVRIDPERLKALGLPDDAAASVQTRVANVAPGHEGQTKLTPEQVMRAVQFGADPITFKMESWSIDYRGDGRWAVLDGSMCLNRDGEFEFETSPSSRDDDFLARCRFSFDEALAAARKGLIEDAAERQALHAARSKGEPS